MDIFALVSFDNGSLAIVLLRREVHFYCSSRTVHARILQTITICFFLYQCFHRASSTRLQKKTTFQAPSRSYNTSNSSIK